MHDYFCMEMSSMILELNAGGAWDCMCLHVIDTSCSMVHVFHSLAGGVYGCVINPLEVLCFAILLTVCVQMTATDCASFLLEASSSMF